MFGAMLLLITERLDPQEQETGCISLVSSLQRSKVKTYFNLTEALKAQNENSESQETLVSERVDTTWLNFNGNHFGEV